MPSVGLELHWADAGSICCFLKVVVLLNVKGNLSVPETSCCLFTCCLCATEVSGQI